MNEYNSYWQFEDDPFKYPSLRALKSWILNNFSATDIPRSAAAFYLYHYKGSNLVAYVKVSSLDGKHLRFSSVIRY